MDTKFFNSFPGEIWKIVESLIIYIFLFLWQKVIKHILSVGKIPHQPNLKKRTVRGRGEV